MSPYRPSVAPPTRRGRARSRLGFPTSGFVGQTWTRPQRRPSPQQPQQQRQQQQHQHQHPHQNRHKHPHQQGYREWGRHAYPHSRHGPFFGAADVHDGDHWRLCSSGRSATSRPLGHRACALPDDCTTGAGAVAVAVTNTGTDTLARPFRPFPSLTRGRLRHGGPSAPSQWFRVQLKGRRRAPITPSPHAQQGTREQKSQPEEEEAVEEAAVGEAVV